MVPRPHFYPRGGKTSSEVVIRCIVRVGGEQVYISTGHRCKPKDWDKRRERVRATAPHATIVNDSLEEMEARLRKLLKELYANNALTPESLRAGWENELRPPPPPEPEVAPNLATVFEQWKRAHKGLRTGRTFASYETALRHVSAALDRPRTELLTTEINLLALQRMVSYMLHDLSISTVAAWKSVRIVRTLLAWCEERSIPVDASYRDGTEKKLMPDTPKAPSRAAVTLTTAEYRQLRDFDLSPYPHLERARDTWIFQANVGVRWGDMENLLPEHRVGNSLDLTTLKNKKSVRVPLSFDALRIWDRYGGPPPIISAQRENDYVKDAARLAGLDRRVRLVAYRGVQREEKTVMLWEAISTHAAKRTFVTALVADGCSIDDVMRITGNTRKTIETYIRLD